jgi:hypothetical protein
MAQSSMSRSDMAMREGGGARVGRKLPLMRPRVRKIVLVLHVVSSVSWLGLSIGYLTLGITAVVTDRPERQHAMFLALGVLGDMLLLPISWTAFLTGLLLAVGTHWGLFQHVWVLVKFALTLVAVVLIPLNLLQGIHAMVVAVEHTAVGQLTDVGGGTINGLLSAGCMSSSMYITCVVLSIFKPWGRTGYGTRKMAGRPAAEPLTKR